MGRQFEQKLEARKRLHEDSAAVKLRMRLDVAFNKDEI